MAITAQRQATQPHQPDVFTRMDTPLGALLITASEAHLHHILFEDMPEARQLSDAALRDAPQHPLLRRAIAQLDDYFAGRRRVFDLPLAAAGTPFQHRVWAELQAIPYGERRSYRQLAQHLGQPGAARAVGLANGRNPLTIVVPCHRVVGSNGRLTGYAGGLERKAWLLEHEARR